MRGGGIWLSLSLLVAAMGVADEMPVRLEVDPENLVVLSRLPPILSGGELERHLTTGLTTTFLFQIESRRHGISGGARIGIRYELWDEVFDVVVLSGDGGLEHREIASFEELEGWWRSLRVVVFELVAVPVQRPLRARVTLEVVPFSQSERDDTQEWFTTTVSGVARGEEENVAQSTEVRRDAVEQMFGVLMATSIRSRSVFSYRWTAELSKGDGE